MIFHWLEARLGYGWATVLTGLWYALLLSLILILYFEPGETFRYENL